MRLAVLMAMVAAVVAAGQSVPRLDGSLVSVAEIDATVLRVMRAGRVPGVAVAILDEGKVVFQKAYGMRDVERRLPLTVDSVLAGASFTKSVFAYMVMQLVAEGKMDLDRPVHTYLPRALPSYRDYRDLAGDLRYRKITARMLLSHTSGLPNFRGESEDRKLRIYFEPGARYAYSGEGIQLLQMVVEAVTGTPVAELMRARVFGPLGMTRTSMVSEARFENDYANGYDERGRSMGHQQRRWASAGGSMQTTVRDFARFLAAVVNGEREEMLRPQIAIRSRRQFPTLDPAVTDANDGIRLSYGLGWGLYWTPYGKAFFKEGNDGGFRCYTVMFDGLRRGIVLMTNSANGEGIFGELLETLQGNTFTPLEWEGYPKIH